MVAIKRAAKPYLVMLTDKEKINRYGNSLVLLSIVYLKISLNLIYF